MTQPTLDGDVPRRVRRLHSRIKDPFGHVAHGEWLRSIALREFVGVCSCGGQLVPQDPEEISGRFDYTARCNLCAGEVVAPGGRIGHRGHGTPARGG